MRTTLYKLKKCHSAKAERRFGELLKGLHIPFKAKVMIGGREIDFLIGKYAIEIDGHRQDVSKNKMLIARGFNPIHFNNWEIKDYPYIKEWLKNICLQD